MLPGSWSEQVSVRVERSELRPDNAVVRALLSAGLRSERKKMPVLVTTAPYLVVEGSVHKALMGHNVYGGPLDFQAASRWFLADVARRLGVDLPDGLLWQVFRADWAEVYRLPSFEAVQEYLGCLNHAAYPRREVGRYGQHSLHAGGYTTAVKFYHKGVEFADHDAKRLRHILDSEQLERLQMEANRLLRVEVAVKLRKLRAEFGGKTPVVADVTREYLEDIHDREASTLLREGQSEMETVRTFREVDARLRSHYGNALGSTLFSTWTRFATLGEKHAREQMKRATYFLHKKQLLEAGCAWHVTDVMLIEHSAIPKGFSPIRSNPLRLVSESPHVTVQLAPYRLAA
jgi:II/X family phage/plasmid replication protein